MIPSAFLSGLLTSFSVRSVFFILSVVALLVAPVVFKKKWLIYLSYILLLAVFFLVLRIAVISIIIGPIQGGILTMPNNFNKIFLTSVHNFGFVVVPLILTIVAQILFRKRINKTQADK